ncbi:MAG: exodeoxyribonuclease V subunit beta [Deltaproteobacteria bacterium]|nr:exodeoxyribonuclease V subunit beta [Deltaproteobacteria bacterium]
MLFRGFEKFTLREIRASLKKDCAPPFHPFFEQCDRLKQSQEDLERVFSRRLLALKARLFRYAEKELHRRKEEKNIQSFDDLLLRLHRALAGKGGEALSKAVSKKFKAALIDEFQDTDPIQYDIFMKIFGPQKRLLFFIGDPKQAIYSFRGADIFAYMKAAKDVQSRHTLVENWRSEPGLISAVNALFEKRDRPFIYDEIPFQGVAPGEIRNPDILKVNGGAGPCLHLWFLEADKLTKPSRPITKTLAREIIPKAVAAEIARLLALAGKGRALLGERPLREEDMAVLVRTNAEARLMQQALSALRIPGVLYNTGNLFDTPEARDMERVLAGIAEPNHERGLKAALTTHMLGVTGEDLYGLMEDEGGWETWLLKFRMYHDLWETRGFMRMFRRLLKEEKVLPRLMSLPDGERRSTNLLHLSEVLHQRAVEKRCAMADILKWLSEQRDKNGPDQEEHLLRLESDEKAVKLVTIHKSKGLEYPIVFCPFTWHGSRIKDLKKAFTFHNEAEDMRPTLDLGSGEMDKNRIAAEKEILAENLRLLYVALTRARNRCYLVWGRFHEAETSAPAYLFHPPPSRGPGSPVDAAGKRFKKLQDKEMLAQLHTLVERAGGAIGLSPMPLGGAVNYEPLLEKRAHLACRVFSGNIDQGWGVSSFSSLLSGRPHVHEWPDRDETDPAVEDSKEDLEDEAVTPGPDVSIFSFPKGTRAGTFLHDVLEHLDFHAKDQAAMEGLVAEKLAGYGFESHWLDAVCEMINKVLSLPLAPESQDLNFAAIPNEDRLNELEFYFPLKPISPETLAKIFEGDETGPYATGLPETIGRLRFAPIRGFMRGFMDLVFTWQNRFYLVDWKSNFLGDRPEDYGPEAMARAMIKDCYVLQYHLYTLALDQYLTLRLPGYQYERHFGGVFYVFLRGVDPRMGPDYGIFRDLPSPQLMDRLRDGLIQPPGSMNTAKRIPFMSLPDPDLTRP